MNDSGLIHDFLDGTLSSAQEEEFFMKLYSNEELRGELKQFINMDKAFNKKLSTFVPSAKSTMAVFSTLSINTPLATTVQTPLASSVSKSPGFLKKYGQGLYSGLLSAAVTAALFLAIFGNSIFNNGKDNFIANNLQNNKPIIQQPAQIAENKIPVTDSRELVKKTKVITKIVYVPVDKKVEVDSKTANSLNNLSEKPLDKSKDQIVLLNESPILNEYKPNFKELQNVDKYLPNLPSNFNLKPNLKAFSINEPIGLIVEIKGGQYWQLQNVPISQSSIPNFYNMGISVGYKLSDNFSVDVDVRNEYYYQQFEGLDDLGEKFLYKQFPNYTTVTAGFKWNFLNYESFSTYSRFMLGGAATGYVGRAVLGFEYSPQSEFKFIVGFEGSCLGYTHQGNTYFSPKLGMNYGVAFNF